MPFAAGSSDATSRRARLGAHGAPAALSSASNPAPAASATPAVAAPCGFLVPRVRRAGGGGCGAPRHRPQWHAIPSRPPTRRWP